VRSSWLSGGPRSAAREQDPRWLPPVLAGLVGLAGYFGPWVPHRAAGLVITGLDLAEYVKFLPQVASGQIPICRELFYMPLVAASLGAALLASRRGLRGAARGLLALAAVPPALAMLPPAWTPSVLRLPEFRLQVIAILVCLAMVPGILVTRYLPDRLVLGILAGLALIAAIWPAWGFLKVLPAIATLYRHPLQPGWGFWASLIGFLAVALVAMAELLRPVSPSQVTR
jgi:hypothetical protein